MEKPKVVRISQWEEIEWLRAGFSTRRGGVSAVYGLNELNLGWTTEDDPAVVEENRRRLVAEVGGGALMELVTIRQQHGSVSHRVSQGMGELVTTDGRPVLQGDGLMTNEPGLMPGVQTADCVPVLMADTRTRSVAAFHAGWRGTLGRIVELGMGQMGREYGTRPQDVVAAIGPAIRQCCFEVGAEVQTAFAGEFPYAEELFTGAGPKMLMDLQEANRRQLLQAGVLAERIVVVAECSACARTGEGGRKYFSHRAEKGVTGRMMSVIGVVA